MNEHHPHPHPSCRGCLCFVCRLRAARLASVRMIPVDALPTGAARSALETLVMAGCDVQVMAPPTWGAWMLYVGALAKARRDGDGYVPLKMWLLSWRHLCASAGLTGYVAGITALDELGEH